MLIEIIFYLLFSTYCVYHSNDFLLTYQKLVENFSNVTETEECCIIQYTAVRDMMCGTLLYSILLCVTWCAAHYYTVYCCAWHDVRHTIIQYTAVRDMMCGTLLYSILLCVTWCAAHLCELIYIFATDYQALAMKCILMHPFTSRNVFFLILILWHILQYYSWVRQRMSEPAYNSLLQHRPFMSARKHWWLYATCTECEHLYITMEGSDLHITMQ